MHAVCLPTAATGCAAAGQETQSQERQERTYQCAGGACIRLGATARWKAASMHVLMVAMAAAADWACTIGWVQH